MAIKSVNGLFSIIVLIKSLSRKITNSVRKKEETKPINILFLEKQDILFLRNNTHQLIGEEGVDDVRTKTVENLANKIHKKILKDLKESFEN